MEGYPATIKEPCEDTRLELRLCPPGEDFNYTNIARPSGVVGWPPVRTSRKNIRTSSMSIKVAMSLPETVPAGGKKPNSGHENSLYVKINMDGVAIGRKVDLKAYNNYQRLSSAVDELFRGLLAAQGETHVTTGLLDGNGEYTLVYEDNEGDRILVGDVPWDMFISSAKRLRVLKTSELTVRFPSSK